MILRGRKMFHFSLDLDPVDRQDLARELVAVLSQEPNKSTCPKLFALLSVVETVEHGDTKGLDVVVDEP